MDEEADMFMAGLLIMFYSLYFGTLGRDCVESGLVDDERSGIFIFHDSPFPFDPPPRDLPRKEVGFS